EIPAPTNGSRGVDLDDGIAVILRIGREPDRLAAREPIIAAGGVLGLVDVRDAEKQHRSEKPPGCARPKLHPVEDRPRSARRASAGVRGRKGDATGRGSQRTGGYRRTMRCRKEIDGTRRKRASPARGRPFTSSKRRERSDAPAAGA